MSQMLRRDFLSRFAAVGAYAMSERLRAQPRALRVGVVGGGIVGASIAYHLAQAGALVTLFEKGQPASGATQNSFAWLNAFVADPHYRALRLQSLMAYHDLDRKLKLKIIWGGYINWATTAAQVQSLRANGAQLDGTANPVRPITAAQLARMAPALEPGNVAAAFFSSIDGHLDPVDVTQRLLAAAQLHGAKVLLECTVQGLDLKSGALRGVETNQGHIPLDRLVVAGGVDTPALMAMAGLDLALRHAPGILAHSRPMSLVTPIIFDAPGTLTFKQMANGSIVGTDSPDPPDIAVHREILARAVPFPDDSLRALHGNRILGKIGAVLPASREVGLERLTLGFRPMPLDELPIVGAVPGAPAIHVAVMHSGVTLAPIIGRYVAREVLTGARVAELAPYRPERFARS
jgi:glycine/D-amino acid oxidase-like deaminating enzyme